MNTALQADGWLTWAASTLCGLSGIRCLIADVAEETKVRDKLGWLTLMQNIRHSEDAVLATKSATNDRADS